MRDLVEPSSCSASCVWRTAPEQCCESCPCTAAELIRLLIVLGSLSILAGCRTLPVLRHATRCRQCPGARCCASGTVHAAVPALPTARSCACPAHCTLRCLPCSLPATVPAPPTALAHCAASPTRYQTPPTPSRHTSKSCYACLAASSATARCRGHRRWRRRRAARAAMSRSAPSTRWRKSRTT